MSGNRRESTNVRPAGEEPPYLTVGTEVSAKYRGAFCEANIKSIKKMVKCKVAFDKGNGSSTVTDDCISGVLKVGSDVEVKLPDGQDMTGTLVKITDSSAYTVVFDDGDERTLKRTSLCLKGEKHFNESETLDHLPLTDPENFGTPVMQQGKKSKRGRRHSTSVDADENKGTDEIPARKKLVQSEENVDNVGYFKVVMVDITEKKKTFSLPALRVPSVDSCYGELKSPENVLVRSFKDGKYIEVHPKDVKEFSKESVVNSSFPKAESVPLKLAVEHAVKYLETKQLPSDWNEQGSKPDETPKSCSSPSSDEESEEDERERDEFMASLTKFLEEKGTPLVRSPVLAHRDLDLYKLFRIVSQMNGMDKIKSWQSVYLKMDTPVLTTTGSYHIKNAYKRYLFDYEQHQREKELKKIPAESKKCGKSDKSSTKPSASTSTNAAAAKQKEETQSKSDSDKGSKELNLSDDNKLLTQEKPSRAARAKTKRELTKTRTERTKTLKSPTLFDLSPKSPCSPRSLSSVSASGSNGCPSPLEGACDSRELRTKTAAEPACCKASKSDEKVLKKAEVDAHLKADVSKDVKTGKQDTSIEDVRDTLGDRTRNEIKEKACKNNGRRRNDNGNGVEVKSGELGKDKEVTRDDAKDDVEIDDVEMGDVEKSDVKKNDAEKAVVKKDDVGKDDVRNDDVKKDAVKIDDTKKEDVKREEVKKEEMKMEDVKKEDLRKEDVKKEGVKRKDVKKEDVKKEDVKRGDLKKEGVKKGDVKKEDIKKSSMKEELGEKMGQDDDDEPEDAVDVVNSPSRTSDSIDSYVWEEKKADKKTSGQTGGKTEAAEKIGGKGQGASDVGCKLEYRLNDRIDVRYGRGRNATVYHAKITSVDPAAEEGLYYLVHYAGWNSRHDEWIGHERIIGRDQKQTRKRTNKEAPRNKAPPKPTIKPAPKPVAKKNGKNGAGKNRKRTPSPTANVAPSRNGNGKASKSRNEKVTVDSLDLAGAIKCQPRVTRQNSLSTPTDAPETNFVGQKSQDAETAREKVLAASPPPTAPAVLPSPKCETEISDVTTENYEEPAKMEVDEDSSGVVVKIEDTPVKTIPDKETVSEEVNVKVNVETTLKRPHEDEVDESPPAKRKQHEEDSISEAVFEEEPADCMKQAEDSASPQPEAAIDDASTPDLTCTEQLSTNCDSPNPYTGEYPRNDGFFSNGIGSEELGSEPKEKDSSSSVDEFKSEKSLNRKAKCRRERKTRAPSSQSSYEGSEYPNGSSNGTSVPIMPSPTRPAKYNFTEDLDELLKKEESSERIRLLQEKIKDIRKVYGELKSEVANIDRKRKRRQKRKREEELSTEEGSARSPSRSSPLTTTNEENTAPATSTPPAVECR